MLGRKVTVVREIFLRAAEVGAVMVWTVGL
jgi:hypothetical protein